MNNLKLKAIIPKKIKKKVKFAIRNIVQSVIYYYNYGTKIQIDKKKISHVVFVCKGNVCRSPFASQRLKFLSQGKIKTIESCGIDVDQGGSPPKESVEVAAEFDCDLSNWRPKGLSGCRMKDADLILAMQYDQMLRLISLYPKKKNNIKLLREFAPLPQRLFCNIDDPYGGNKIVFRKSYLLIDKALKRLL